ncbi:TolC family protein [bacterium]|nr:TolC family protein [bacterium]
MFTHKILTKLIFALALAVMLPTAGRAETDLQLSLEKCVEIALEKNPQLKMAEKEVTKARVSVGQAYSTILPQVTGSASLQRAWEIQQNTLPNFIKSMLPPTFPGYNEMPDFVSMAFGLENTAVAGVTLTQPLFLGGAGITAIKMANAGRRAIEQSLELERQTLIYNTVNAYYACLLSKEVIRVQAEALKQALTNFEMVEKNYNAGSASGFDKMRAEVTLAGVQPAVITARNNYHSALTALRMMLGLDKDTVIDVSGEFNYVEDDFADKSLAKIQQMAIEKRPELIALYEQKYIANKNVAMARSSFMPKLFFQTDYSYMAMRDDMNFEGNNFSKGFTSAVSMQIPLFTGLYNAREYQKAKLDYQIMLDTEKQVNDGLMAEVEIVYNRFRETREKLTATLRSVKLAEETLRLSNLMYEEGTNTQLDVISTQSALTSAQMVHAASIYQYQLARYQLRKVTGILKNTL